MSINAHIRTEGQVQGQQGQQVLNPYQVLQIRRDATPAEIRHSYQRLALLYHPGRRTSVTNKQLFILVSACYETLIDDTARERIDEILMSKKDLRPHANHHHGHKHASSTPRGKILIGERPIQLPRLLSMVSGEESSSDDDDTATTHSTSEDGRDVPHYSKVDTDRLFGGPMKILYQVNDFRAFTPPLDLFDDTFGSHIFPRSKELHDNSTLTTLMDPTELALESTTSSILSLATTPSHPTTTGGWSEVSKKDRKKGVATFRTTRVLPTHRKIYKEEKFCKVADSGRLQRIITVTSQDLVEEQRDDSCGNCTMGNYYDSDPVISSWCATYDWEFTCWNPCHGNTVDGDRQ